MRVALPILSGTEIQVKGGAPLGLPKKLMSADCRCCGFCPNFPAELRRSSCPAPCWLAFIANSWTRGEDIFPSAHRFFRLSVNGVPLGSWSAFWFAAISLCRMPRGSTCSLDELAGRPAADGMLSELASGFKPSRSLTPPFRFIEHRKPHNTQSE